MMTDLPSSWMLVNGSAKLGAVELDDRALAPFEGNMAPSGVANITRYFAINQTEIVTWVINGEPFSEPTRPIIYGSDSDGWNATTTLFTRPNATVDIIITVANDSMDTVSPTVYPVQQHCSLRLTREYHLDGASNAPARSQILVPWGRRGRFSVRTRRGCSFDNDQSPEPAVSRYHRLATFRLGCH